MRKPPHCPDSFLIVSAGVFAVEQKRVHPAIQSGAAPFRLGRTHLRVPGSASLLRLAQLLPHLFFRHLREAGRTVAVQQLRRRSLIPSDVFLFCHLSLKLKEKQPLGMSSKILGSSSGLPRDCLLPAASSQKNQTLQNRTASRRHKKGQAIALRARPLLRGYKWPHTEQSHR